MPAPQRFGPFEVLGQIAGGGQGAVLRARRLADGAPAALKLLLRADPRSVRRFRQEAQVLERLDHPSVVRVLGHGEEDGVPWLAMELVEGPSLRALVDERGPPPFAFTARTLEALARALDRCHAQGVVHRDLKPENVIVERATGRPVLVDFGVVARDAEVFGALSLDALSRLSATGELKGTPAFMAPEQVAPDRFGPVGPATDVHALGATLHVLLTGAPPFSAGALPALLNRIVDAPPPDPRASNPAVPEGLAALCRRALAKRPEERPASAGEVARALEALLPACEAADRARPPTASSPAARRPASATPAPAAPAPAARAGGLHGAALRPGAVVGPYEVLSLLGQGGMGTVFRVRHRALGVERALKVLSAGGDGGRRARFLREIEALARARHDHVVRIHEADTDGATCWFAMDLVEGEPLDEVLRRGRLPLERALAVAAGVARGVQALHGLGIVHRDLKPQNVILAADGRPVVIDLGLAVDPARDERLTRTGAVVGTVRYMAPEQLSGQATARTDVYALGLITFELVTGVPALEGASASELMARIITEARPRVGHLDPALGAHLDAAVAAACERDPARRPPDAGAFADLLERAAGDPGPPVGVGRRRRRVAGALAAACAGALAVALVGPALRSTAATPDVAAPGSASDRPAEAVVDARTLEDARRAARLAREHDLSAAERLRRCDEWLARFGALGAPDHDDVAALRRAARREVPLLTLTLADGREARPVWLDGGARLLLWGRAHDLVTLRGPDGEEERAWRLGAAVQALELMPDGRAAAVLLGDGASLRVVDLAGGEVRAGPALTSPPAGGAPLHALAVSPDGARLALGDRAGGLRVVDAATGRDVAPPAAGHASPVWSLAFSPDGRRLVSGAGDWADARRPADNALRVWDAATLAPLARVGLSGVPYFARFAPDRRRVAVGTSGYRIHVLDVEAPDAPPVDLEGEGTGAMTLGLSAPPAHRGAVRGAAFDPAGRLVSVGGERGAVREADNELRAWDVDAARELVGRRRSLPAVPLWVDVAPDGRVAVGYQSGLVQVFAPEDE